MKHIRKFNEGLTDFFKRKEVKENPEKSTFKPKEVRVPGLSYYATEFKLADGTIEYPIWEVGKKTPKLQDPLMRTKPVAVIKEFDGYFILHIFGVGLLGSTSTVHEKVKTKSIEQALKYLESLKKEKEAEKLKKEKEFDKDISDEDF